MKRKLTDQDKLEIGRRLAAAVVPGRPHRRHGAVKAVARAFGITQTWAIQVANANRPLCE